ncbi:MULTISPECIES: glycosyltransferase family 39 protein [Legionella]|uniref:Dolichyl-phosphate mannosyltransferase n=1 Tax=Legionella drozanskii LLAP-1 TaxID=1212489 RepID=A0A0W0SXL2_9GAMM|nr:MULTISPECIES: glycosyltransferase family 39 protein [Legionella]KTC87996.1 dolichyl-phosphate mannosyltransferase [Legionella drozanskii LLAP-1]PJE07324.1 MAG: hypothetical protein CK430_13990 [Legionella sp.]
MKSNFKVPILLITISVLLRLFFILKADLLVQEAYYWNYSNHLDFSYLDHPPMVALLIKLGTLICGTNELGVRVATIPCWLLTVFFSYRLTELIQKGTGKYSILLLSILPFFFIHSLIITPDVPLILCWSATLYFLYQALVLEKPNSWYWAGLWIGLGLLSKYTIALLGFSTLIYMILFSRKWFSRKEPYLCALFAIILFMPVIYWNWTHEWASFLFQSKRRLENHYVFSFHALVGLVIVFLAPIGVWEGWQLVSNKFSPAIKISDNNKRFLKLFSLIPLLVFSVFSLFHELKLNWIGPSLLAIIPWLQILMNEDYKNRFSMSKNWVFTLSGLLFFYASIIYCVYFGKPQAIHQYTFAKQLPWENLTSQIQNLAKDIEFNTKSSPIIVPLDTYNIGSEFAFYQEKFFQHGQSDSIYPIIGAHIFGTNSLMYKYWGNVKETEGRILILVSKERYRFNNLQIWQKTIFLTSVLEMNPHDELNKTSPDKLYYQIVKKI